MGPLRHGLMEVILFIAVALLFGLHFRLTARVRELEAELRHIDAGPLAAADTESRPAQASVVVEPDRSAPAIAIAQPADAQAHGRSDPLATAPVGAEPADAKPAPISVAALFERFVGGRLLIWIGGIALAVAGIFLIRASVGLITPAVRMVLAALFGLILLAGGELARSRPGRLPDPRVPQTLVGAGILILYAAPYGALVLYHLMSTGAASTLMVMVTAAALVLSLRHGAPTAVMGLAGGFATPLLVGDTDAGAIPLLGYLALLNIALFAIASRRGWTWLAASAVLLSFAWTGALLWGPQSDALAAGGFILLLSVSASLLRTGAGWQIDFIRPAAIGLVELAMLVARVDLDYFAWGLFGLLSAASFALATRRVEYRPIPAFALALALILILLKTQLGKDVLPMVAGTTLLFAAGAVPLALRRPERLLWTSVVSAALAGPILILRVQQPGLVLPFWYGAALVLLSAGPLLLALGLRRIEDDRPLLVATGAALLLAAIGLVDLLPKDLVGAAWLFLALAAAWVARCSGRVRLGHPALVTAAAALVWSTVRVAPFWAALLLSLGGLPPLAAQLPYAAQAAQTLALPGLLILALLRLLPSERRRPWLLAAALFCLTASLYLLFKQAWGLTDHDDFLARGFAERTIVTQSLFAIGWLICRMALPGLDERERRAIGIAFTAFAGARLLWFDLLIDNPAFVGQSVGPLILLNWLLPAYLLSAFWLYSARRRADNAARSAIWLGLFLAALVGGVMLMVRQNFVGPILTGPPVSAEESYVYSLAGLLLSLGLLLSGVRVADKALRIAGLALLTATTCKVFLVDASALEGVLRILSFLGLGIALIGIGKLYTKLLDAEGRGMRDHDHIAV